MINRVLLSDVPMSGAKNKQELCHRIYWVLLSDFPMSGKKITGAMSQDLLSVIIWCSNVWCKITGACSQDLLSVIIRCSNVWCKITGAMSQDLLSVIIWCSTVWCKKTGAMSQNHWIKRKCLKWWQMFRKMQESMLNIACVRSLQHKRVSLLIGWNDVVCYDVK